MTEQVAEVGMHPDNSTQDVRQRNDKTLITSLADKERKRNEQNPEAKVGVWKFRNTQLAEFINTLRSRSRKPGLPFTSSQLIDIEGNLEDNHALVLPLSRVHNEELGELVIMDATPAKTGDHQMSEHLWIRDQAQGSAALFHNWANDPEKSSQSGKDAQELLLSTLSLMSSDSQLKRFNHLIQHLEDRDDQSKWPQIYVGLDNLDGKKHESWKHKQDAWQMLGYTTFEALDKGLITVDDLQPRHKKFLASIAPFLEAIDFTTNTNSGSWEEGALLRTSAMGIETALLNKIKNYSTKEGFEFLSTSPEVLNSMIEKGLRTIAQRLPFESPNYAFNSPQYRQADAALLYLLDCNIPQLLVEYDVDIRGSVHDADTLAREKRIEKMILNQVKRLQDPVTNGIKRYGGTPAEMRDTYLGTNYGTNEIQYQRDEMYRTTPDYTERFEKRDKIVPHGPAAAWTHPVAQLSAWSLRRYLQTGDESYYDRGMENYIRSLSLLTGRDEHNAVIDKDTRLYKVNKVESYRMPECWMTYRTEDNQTFVVASPNTPLNWATMKLKEATRQAQFATQMKEKKGSQEKLLAAA